ncbi:MAG: hypothetical protein WDW36_005502 [Sanguina aurantia]
MTSEGVEDEVSELISFLVHKRAELKAGALDIVQGLTAEPLGQQQLKRHLRPLLLNLVRVLPEPGSTGQAALVSLVNLSQDTEAVTELLSLNVVGRIMERLREPSVSTEHSRLLSMLLSNVTVSEQGSSDLLQLGKGPLEGFNMAVLLKRLVMSGVMMGCDQPAPGQGPSEVEDPFEHVAAVLTNVTRMREARLLMLEPGRGLLQVLLAQMRSPRALRRLGAAGAVKNCCMSAQADGTLQHLIADEFVLRAMLLPINGLEPKEQEPEVREAMALSIALLADTDDGRAALWKINAPETLRKGYELEEHTGVCRAMERAAEIFLAAGGVMPEGAEGGGGDDDEVGFVGLTGGLGMVGSGWGSKKAPSTASSGPAPAGQGGASCGGGERSSTGGDVEAGMAVGVSGGGWGIGGGGGGRALAPVSPAASSAASVTGGAASIQE